MEIGRIERWEGGIKTKKKHPEKEISREGERGTKNEKEKEGEREW